MLRLVSPLTLALILVGCGALNPPPTVTPTPVPTSTSTPTPLPSPTLLPTVTPLPAPTELPTVVLEIPQLIEGGTPPPFDLRRFKRVFNQWQAVMAEDGWNSLFLSNHDLPRQVSKYGDDGVHRCDNELVGNRRPGGAHRGRDPLSCCAAFRQPVG